MKHKDKYYIFANWKMYLDYVESNILANVLANESAKISPAIKVAIFPSTLSFYPASQVLKDAGFSVGPQNFFWQDRGGYTGESSAWMYASLGSEYALVGHSERRHIFHETEEEIRKKMEAAVLTGLTPALCVGETANEKNNNLTKEKIKTQIFSALEGLDWPSGKELVVAYEPVWAIGTGEACDPKTAENIHELINDWIKKVLPEAELVMLYGGSVKGENVADYLIEPHINGVLVGGASAKIESWMEIVGAIENV